MKTAVTVMDLQAEKHAPPEPLELPPPPPPPVSLPDIWERPLIVRSAPAWWKIVAVSIAVSVGVELVMRGWR